MEPGGKKRIDRLADEFVQEQLEAVGWDNVTDKMLFGVFYGYAVAEINYVRDGNRLGWDAIKVRSRHQFRFNDKAELCLLTPTHMLECVEAVAPYFWHYATGADHDDEPHGLGLGLGLGHWLYWPVLFKRNGLRFWQVLLEKFAKLLAANQAIQVDSGITIPEGMLIEMLEASRSSTADYQAMTKSMDAAIAKVVLGQTMTADSGSSRSQAEVHMDVRQYLVKADSDLVNKSARRGPIKWLVEVNFPGAAIPKLLRDIAIPEVLKERAERDDKVAGLGFKPTLDYIKET